MKKLLLFILATALSVSIIRAQQPTFAKVFYDDNGGEPQGYSIIRTFDNNYIIAGVDKEAFAMEIDSAGSIIWNKNYGSTSIGHFHSITATADSGFVMAGYTYHTGGGSYYDLFYIKIKSDGDTLWTKKITFGNSQYALSVQQTNDGGYIITGPASVTKTDQSGNIIWSNQYSGTNITCEIMSIKQTPDSGYIAAGYYHYISPSNNNAFLLKLGQSGQVEWCGSPFATSSSSDVCDVFVLNDGTLSYFSKDNGVEIIKTDFSGNILWSKNYPTIHASSWSNYTAPKLHTTSDDGYVFVSFSPYAYPSGQLIKFDSTGNQLWIQGLEMYASDVTETSDNGFMVIGNGPVYGVKSISTDHGQIGVIKTDSVGNSVACVSSYATSSTDDVINLTPVSLSPAAFGTTTPSHPNIYNAVLTIESGCVAILGGIDEHPTKENTMIICPNPANDFITVDFKISDSGVNFARIFTINGKLVKTIAINHKQTLVSISDLASGVYVVKVTGDKDAIVKRLIKE